MATAQEPNEPPKLTSAVLEDKIKPEEDNDFCWPQTVHGDCWRLLLTGFTDNKITPSKVNKYTLNMDQAATLLDSVVLGGKGIELLNTVERVHDRGLTVMKNSLIFTIAFCTCRKEQTVKKRGFEMMQKICRRSVSFLTFIDYREKVSKHVYRSTGWSKALRAAVRKWYQSHEPAELAKLVMEYPRHNKWTHRDVLRLAHIPPNNECQKIIFSFLIVGLKKTSELFKNESEDDSQKLLVLLEELTAVRKAENASEIVPFMDRLKLPWNFVSYSLYHEAELWEEMIAIMPFDVMIQNTARMAKMKLLEGDNRTKTTFMKRCLDKKEIDESGIHPFQVLTQREYYGNAVNDVKRKPCWKSDRQIVVSLNLALTFAMDSNLKSSGKRFFVALDASDSMKAHLINNDHVQCSTAAAMIALCLVKVEKKVVVKAFSRELEDVKITGDTNVDEIVKKLAEIPLGGCDCSRPLIYAKSNKVKVDIFVVITDKETWRGKTNPFDALKQYRKALKIPAKLIVVMLNPDGASGEGIVSNPQDRGILLITGFSAAMAKVMSNFSKYPY